MIRIPLVALKTFPYASRSIAAGESFDAVSTFDAHVLIQARLADATPDAMEFAQAQPVIVDPAGDIHFDQKQISHHVWAADEVLDIPPKRARRVKRVSDDA